MRLGPGLNSRLSNIMEILRALPEQADCLSDISFSAKRYWGYPENWIRLWAPLLTISPDMILNFDTYAAYVENEPVAFYMLSFQGERANLEHFWVKPEFVGKGIGAQLFRHAQARCKAKGGRYLEIESDPNALGFYQRMGAHKIGEHYSEVDGQVRALPVLEIELT